MSKKIKKLAAVNPDFKTRTRFNYMFLECFERWNAGKATALELELLNKTILKTEEIHEQNQACGDCVVDQVKETIIDFANDQLQELFNYFFAESCNNLGTSAFLDSHDLHGLILVAPEDDRALDKLALMKNVMVAVERILVDRGIGVS
jgi:hypothetical protein